MPTIIDNTISQIKSAIIKAAGVDSAAPDFAIERPANPDHGDYSANAAMVWAKTLGQNPRSIAEGIVANIDTADTFIKSLSVAGPGFINITLADNYYAAVLDSVRGSGADYGRSDYGGGQKVMVEFVSANPTGPMHIGNARGGALGDCLASVLEWSGHKVCREFYINDAGNQIINLGYSLEARYMQIFDESFPFPEDGYQGPDVIELAAGFAKTNGDSLVNSDSESRRETLINYALPINIDKLRRDLLKYRIEYDVWFKESSLHNSGEVDRVIDILKAGGHTYEQDGALWLKATEVGEEKDKILIRANGTPTYVVPDIAYHYNKFITRGFDVVINILGADHHGYSQQLKHSVEALGLKDKQLEFVLTQMVRLMRDGQPVKASKRTGKSITLSTLLDEVPLDAARFFFNMRESDTHLDFDLDLAIEQSNKNPVYYVQYAHARICSIIKNLAAEGVEPRECSLDELTQLAEPQERDLIRHLGEFPGEIILAAKVREPARITRYVYELATLFHKFYNACRVKCDDDSLMQARLTLCQCALTTLANALAILKVDAPENM